MWEPKWVWNEEWEDYEEQGGEWILMDEYDALYNKELTDRFYGDNPFARYYTAGEPGWWTLDILLDFSTETGEVDRWDPQHLSTELPEDGSGEGFATVMSFVY